MSVNTVAFIPVSKLTPSVFHAATLARDGIQKYLRSKLADMMNHWAKIQASSVTVSCAPDLEMMQFSFKDGDDSREMSMHFHCHSDYAEVHAGPKIILSLGSWGNSVALIQAAGRPIAASVGSQLHWTESDCSDEAWQVEESEPK